MICQADICLSNYLRLLLKLSAVSKNIDRILAQKKLSRYQLNKLINYYESDLNKMIKSQKAMPEHVIEKIAPILEVSESQIRSWILADKFPKENLELAASIKKETKLKKDQLILTVKIDEILQSKSISRTALSKQIKYSQSGLNRMIIGQESLSQSVKERIAQILEVPVEEITSWVIADKYDIEVIEMAVKELEVQS